MAGVDLWIYLWVQVFLRFPKYVPWVRALFGGSRNQIALTHTKLFSRNRFDGSNKSASHNMRYLKTLLWKFVVGEGFNSDRPI